MIHPVSPLRFPGVLLPGPAPGAADRPGRTVGGACFDLVSVQQNPRPEGLSVGQFQTRDGLALRTARHRGRGGTRGTVVLLQGRADIIEKYYEVVSDLVARGFDVVTFDWRGQGGSQRLHRDPSLNHLEHFGDCVQDLIDIVDDEVRPLRRGPVIALAHSMGAAILLHALRRRPELVDRSVLTAPMIEISPRLRPPGAEMLVRLCHGAGLAGRPVPASRRRLSAQAASPADNVLTSDAERYLRTHHVLAAAPHLAVGRPTVGWLHQAFEAMRTLRRPETAEAIVSPLLVVAGDRDRVTSTPAALSFARRTGRGAALALPHCAHDVMMERDVVRDAFWLAFDAFVND